MSLPTTITPKLHPWIEANPPKELAQLKRSALISDILFKISIVAIGAISTTVLALSFATSVATGGGLSFILVGLVLFTPVLAIASSKFQAKSLEAKQEISIQEKITKKYEEIKEWKPEQFEDFATQYQISKHSNVPLTSLSPLIARFLARSEDADQFLIDAKQALEADSFKKPELRSARFSQRQQGWSILQNQFGPARLNAAFALHILNNPYTKPKEKGGSITPKDRAQTSFEEEYDEKSIYFTSSNATKTLSIREIEQLSPLSIYQQIFQRSEAL